MFLLLKRIMIQFIKDIHSILSVSIIGIGSGLFISPFVNSHSFAFSNIIGAPMLIIGCIYFYVAVFKI